MEQAQAALEKTLREHGFSVTSSRLAAFRLLWQQEPQSMHELLQHSRGQIDRVSLYRTIGLYERLGIVQRLYMGWKYKVELSDAFSHHHHHMTCLRCGRFVTLPEDTAIEAAIQQLANQSGMTAERHQLEIQGYCQQCRPA